jgi:DNA polymerase-4
VKVRGGDFATRSRSETALTATTDVAVLMDTAQRLVMAALPAAGVRLIGASLSGLTSAVQQSLFGEPPNPGHSYLEPAEPITPSTAAPAGGQHAVSTAGPQGRWQAGGDVGHPAYGHGWVQGAGHGRVTIRFETRSTGPGPVRTFATTDPDLRRADPLTSLNW